MIQIPRDFDFGSELNSRREVHLMVTTVLDDVPPDLQRQFPRPIDRIAQSLGFGIRYVTVPDALAFHGGLHDRQIYVSREGTLAPTVYHCSRVRSCLFMGGSCGMGM